MVFFLMGLTHSKFKLIGIRMEEANTKYWMDKPKEIQRDVFCYVAGKNTSQVLNESMHFFFFLVQASKKGQ